MKRESRGFLLIQLGKLLHSGGDEDIVLIDFAGDVEEGEVEDAFMNGIGSGSGPLGRQR